MTAVKPTCWSMVLSSLKSLLETDTVLAPSWSEDDTKKIKAVKVDA